MSGSGALERLRAANQRTVIGLLAGEGPMSRADLVRASGLSRTTVSSLVAELIRAGQITETDDQARPHQGGSGRPPVQVRLRAPAGGVVGVDVGHGHVRVAVADRLGAVHAEEHALVDVDRACSPRGRTCCGRRCARSPASDRPGLSPGPPDAGARPSATCLRG